VLDGGISSTIFSTELAIKIRRKESLNPRNFGSKNVGKMHPPNNDFLLKNQVYYCCPGGGILLAIQAGKNRKAHL
jgi:hypothetical protein